MREKSKRGKSFAMHFKLKEDKCITIESPKVNPCTYGKITCDNGSKNIQWRKAISLVSGAG